MPAHPMFRPALTDLRAIRASFDGAIDDPTPVLVVAEDQDRVVGMMQANPDGQYRRTATIGIAAVTTSIHDAGIGTAMLNTIVNWSAEQGLDACAVEWTSANLASDSFWRSRGFIPARHKLTRRIDPRVSWANTDLS